MRFEINIDKFTALCYLKGWRHPVSDLARATGYSRSYVRDVMTKRVNLTDQFMLKYIKVSGVKDKKWKDLFEIDLSYDMPDDHQSWNYAKWKKERPYKNPSVMFDLRKLDEPDLECREFLDTPKKDETVKEPDMFDEKSNIDIKSPMLSIKRSTEIIDDSPTEISPESSQSA